MDETKTCSKCGEVKPVDAFRVRHLACKSCEAIYGRTYYEANKEKLLAQQRAYKKENREHLSAQHTAYREANHETIREQKRAYEKANQETIRARRKAYREANKEKLYEMQKTQRKSLQDTYIKGLISHNLKISKFSNLIPQSIIDLKRLQVQIKRKLKELKRHENTR